MHLAFGSMWVDPRDSPGEPMGMVQFWYFFFPVGEGSCLVLETALLDHGNIPKGFARGSATGKVKSALPGTMVDVWKWAKSVQKNLMHLFVIFANEN